MDERTKITICHIVNFVFPPIKKYYNEQYQHSNLLGECLTKTKQYEVLKNFNY